MSYVGNTPISAAFLVDTFSGNGSTTAFTMSVAPANTSSILVVVTGVTQDPSTYSVSGTTLTFSAAPPTGTSNISVRYLGIPASGVTTTAYRTITNFTATAGQTTFTPASYTVGYIDVYRNGVRLTSADFTASNGITVVLTNAANAGDSVVTESFYVSSVLNAIPATAGSVSSTYLADANVTQAKLGTNVAGNGPAFLVYLSSNQSITGGVTTAILFDTKLFDTNSFYDTTNYWFKPTIAGYYQLSYWARYNSATTVNTAEARVIKNGSINYAEGSLIFSNGGVSTGSCLVYLNGSTDYVQLFMLPTNSSTIQSGQVWTGFSGVLSRAA